MADKNVSIRFSARDDASSVMQRMERGLSDVRGSLLAFQGAIGGVTLGALATEAVQASIAVDRMRNALTSATGSSQGAAEGLSFVRGEALRLGLDLESAAGGFTKISASARGTSLEGQGVRDIFTAVAEASTVMGLSSEEANGALLAISQMMSKGKVSAEELRGQLGERLPGAFQIAARSMGVTTGELDKMLSSGQIMAEDFLPKFAAELRTTYGDALSQAMSSTQAEINRAKTAIFEASAAIGDVLSPAVRRLSGDIADLASEVPGLAGNFQIGMLEIEKAIARANVAFSIDWLGPGTLAEKKRQLDFLFEEIEQEFTGRQQRLVFGTGSGGGTEAPAGDSAGGGTAGTTPIGTAAKADKVEVDALRESITDLIILKNQLTAPPLSADLTTQQPSFGLGEFGLNLDSDRLEQEQLFLENREFLWADAASRLTQLEQDAATDRLAIEQRVTQQKMSMYGSVVQAGVDFLNVFSGKSRAFALASLVLTKGLAIAETFIYTQAAAARALADTPGPPPVKAAAAAQVEAFGYTKMALIAATGIAQAAMSGGGGGNYGGGTPDSPIVTQPTGGQSRGPTEATIIINNPIGSREWFENNLPEVLRDMTGRNVIAGVEVR